MRTDNFTIPTLLLKILPGRFLIWKHLKKFVQTEICFIHNFLLVTRKFCRIWISLYAFIFSELCIIFGYNFLTHMGQVENCP